MQHRSAGFTLLEMLIAFTIFSIVLVAIYGSLSTSLRGEAEARAAISSAQVAHTVMSEVGHSIPLSQSAPTGRENDGTTWALRITPAGPAAQAGQDGPILQLFRLELTVREPGGGTFEVQKTKLGRVDG